jgi:hypothetical protein
MYHASATRESPGAKALAGMVRPFYVRAGCHDRTSASRAVEEAARAELCRPSSQNWRSVPSGSRPSIVFICSSTRQRLHHDPTAQGPRPAHPRPERAPTPAEPVPDLGLRRPTQSRRLRTDHSRPLPGPDRPDRQLRLGHHVPQQPTPAHWAGRPARRHPGRHSDPGALTRARTAPPSPAGMPDHPQNATMSQDTANDVSRHHNRGAKGIRSPDLRCEGSAQRGPHRPHGSRSVHLLHADHGDGNLGANRGRTSMIVDCRLIREPGRRIEGGQPHTNVWDCPEL